MVVDLDVKHDSARAWRQTYGERLPQTRRQRGDRPSPSPERALCDHIGPTDQVELLNSSLLDHYVLLRVPPTRLKLKNHRPQRPPRQTTFFRNQMTDSRLVAADHHWVNRPGPGGLERGFGTA